MSFIDKLLEFFLPWKSSKWVKWESQNDITTCVECKKLHGKIFATKEVEAIALWPRHQFCRCKHQVTVEQNAFCTQMMA